VAWAAYTMPVLPNLYFCGGVLVPELVPLEEPGLFAPLVFVLFVFDGLAVPEVPLPVDPALFAPDVLRSELVPEPLRSELVPVFVRVRSVSLVLVPLVLLLLGRVVGSLLVVSVFDRLRVFVPVSLLSQPMNAIPPSAKAAATRIP
jgi:hypothetical protein